MDEPTMGLAPVMVERVLATIATVNRQGVAVFMVEQNAALALGIADRGYVVRNGRLVLAGEAAALLADSAVQAAYLGRRVADGPGVSQDESALRWAGGVARNGLIRSTGSWSTGRRLHPTGR